MSAGAEFPDSPTWPHVLAFARLMERKLAQNRHKGDREGWIGDSPTSLLGRVCDELVECLDTIEVEQPGARSKFAARQMVQAAAMELRRIGAHNRQVGNFRRTPEECADGANFFLMVADVVGRTLENEARP